MVKKTKQNKKSGFYIYLPLKYDFYKKTAKTLFVVLSKSVIVFEMSFFHFLKMNKMTVKRHGKSCY